MKKNIALYTMLFLLPNESNSSSSSITERFFTFFAGNRQERQANQERERNTLRLIGDFLQYRLNIFSQNTEACSNERKFMEKTQCTNNDFKMFFNSFLSNRKALIRMLWEENTLAIGTLTDRKRYADEKTPEMISYYQREL